MFKISNDEYGNLIAEEGGVQKSVLIIGCLFAAVAFLAISAFSFKHGGDGYFIAIPALVFGLFMAYGFYAAVKLKRYFLFSRNENKVFYRMRYSKGTKEQEFEYYHADISKNHNAHGIPFYSFVVLINNSQKPYIILDRFNSDSTPRNIRDFCVDVLKRTNNYNPPQQTLEEQTFNRTDLTGTVAETVRAFLRALR